MVEFVDGEFLVKAILQLLAKHLRKPTGDADLLLVKIDVHLEYQGLRMPGGHHLLLEVLLEELLGILCKRLPFELPQAQLVVVKGHCQGYLCYVFFEVLLLLNHGGNVLESLLLHCQTCLFVLNRGPPVKQPSFLNLYAFFSELVLP